METTIILISEENTSARQKIHSQSYYVILYLSVPVLDTSSVTLLV